MKMRAGFLATCAVGALVIGIGYASPTRAADVMPTKAPPIVAPTWWYEGFAEIGGRFDLNSPDKSSLGKFYEYRDLRPGVFGNFYIAAHRTNPIDIDVWGTNVGWDDQAFGFDFAKVGEHYLTFTWDETPHVFSKNAKTTFTANGNTLTSPYYVATTGALPTAATPGVVAGLSNEIDVKYRRDTASVRYRWTPSSNWDINIDYSHMHRHGTQPLNAVSFTQCSGGACAGDTGTRRTAIELAKPVDDTTQNGNINGEYSGSTPWGKPFNVALGYGFSIYNTDYDSVIFNNPWNPTNGNNTPQWNRYGLFPDNNAQTFSLTAGVGLPWNSRYMGTVQYSIAKQDETFLPSNMNPLATLAMVSASSLGGDARTTLVNNVLHTRITPNLKSTLRYRYFDYHSRQDPITITGAAGNPDTNNNSEDEVAHPLNFTKQNASAELVWRAIKWLNLGARYDWERWNRNTIYADVGTTNENSGKVFTDAKWDWAMLRASLQYGARRYTAPYMGQDFNSDTYRMKQYADRNRWKGMGSLAIDLPANFSITPNGGFRWDDYLTDPFSGVGTTSEVGLVNDHSWNAGVDLSWSMNHAVAFYVSYNYESGYRQVYERNSTPDLNMESRDRTHTFIVGTKFTLIPEKLKVKANYTFTRSTSAWTSSCTIYGCRNTPQPTFPDAHNTLHRLDVQAKYLFDKDVTRNVGWMGQAYLKARVLWEKDYSDNWQTLSDQLGYAVNPGDTTMRRAIFLATGNPDYNVVVGMLTFGVKW